ncbi:hypothetical protein ASF66_10985 [Pseudomonas sp. Leaf129]|uniref:hypothetical protein n=1 Tax=Pseudomonas sp. Leaf129 TaxID=1736268 RepID=UPI000702F6DE|nr:hypothetical protein [Pseudomonas sp. Leaf129]KQQ62203.1 hypothetical protein ASF66_10985 [Pseudomonas sp. Leaf129]
MRRLSKLWTAVGSAIPVVVGSALGGLGLVDLNLMLAIALIPQVIFLVIGEWSDFERTSRQQVWVEQEYEQLPRYVVRRQHLTNAAAMNEALVEFDLDQASLGRAR